MTVTQANTDAAQAAIARIRERREQACDVVEALCKPRDAVDARRWTMSIPARPDHDPDLVIGRALDDEKALLDALELAMDSLELLGDDTTFYRDKASVPRYARQVLAAITKTLESSHE